VCPENPPCVGKRRLAVQEILEARGNRDTHAQESDEIEGSEQPVRTSQAVGVSREVAPRASLPSPQLPGAPRRTSLLPLQLLRRSSVRPGVVIPRVRISKAPAPTFQPERAAAKGSTKDSTHLQLPKWRYKEAKEEKRKAEEAEKQRVAAAAKKENQGRAHILLVYPGGKGREGSAAWKRVRWGRGQRGSARRRMRVCLPPALAPPAALHLPAHPRQTGSLEPGPRRAPCLFAQAAPLRELGRAQVHSPETSSPSDQYTWRANLPQSLPLEPHLRNL